MAAKQPLSGRGIRRKGRNGQAAFKLMLSGRSWTFAGLESGTAVEDIIAIDPEGNSWSVEVKNVSIISPAHRAQAQEQARSRKLPWMLANHIEGTSSWLIQRKGRKPVVWNEDAI